MNDTTRRKTVLVTGANGYIGNAVTKAFSRAGWRTYGLIRKQEDALDLAENEIYPVIGSPTDLSFLDQTNDVVFDVIVSNTEDRSNPVTHFEKVRAMIGEVTRRSQSAGVRPLVMFTSGCKDYGKMSLKNGDPGLKPHTEDSPMNAPAPLVPRMNCGLWLLESSHAGFDATVLRPTIVYGHTSSHCGALFDLAANSSGVLKLIADPNAIMHSLHVDDCGDAYVALAEHPLRSEVAQQAFNLSNARYETAKEIGEALAESYGLPLEFVIPTDGVPMQTAHGLANFWQWVGSDKVRAVTGWSEHRSTFVDGIDEYRMAYEATIGRKS
ncbi:NAD-dependent epimerase/dehydratase family protein [Bordetella muralis]|uniref:NAD-dependent epimerase/dehydratase family protein n=1 Tax=Bordetella muralis TaxID=1649130 RepID=UPI0039F001C4